MEERKGFPPEIPKQENVVKKAIMSPEENSPEEPKREQNAGSQKENEAKEQNKESPKEDQIPMEKPRVEITEEKPTQNAEAKENEIDEIQVKLLRSKVKSKKLAWENLEVARFIVEKKFESMQKDQKSADDEMKVVLNNYAKILLRIGDLECWRENFPEALKEYEKCYKLRLQINDLKYSRDIAEV